FSVSTENISHSFKPGTIITDGKTKLNIAVNNGIILIKELQLAGKKRIKIADFLRGFSINEKWKVNLK
ncbi:MAG: methionyl-tRNA formyltransferase, partial [Bacteroidales bacterium]|nr:methionyl-tRNA formyltransferase [Bacteroidales bacterium]